ncbi:hypothetical protein GQ53DRAFT_765485 [Thozetella sp. PMI_491]|nr:hypothetical protein GQ53DRAFT_765485 [Thozetella sp. PMI_491]
MAETLGIWAFGLLGFWAFGPRCSARKRIGVHRCAVQSDPPTSRVPYLRRALHGNDGGKAGRQEDKPLSTPDRRGLKECDIACRASAAWRVRGLKEEAWGMGHWD